MRALAIALVALLAACGGGKKQDTTPPPPPGDGTACEPGRCLDDIAKVVGEHRAETHACSQKGLKRDPGSPTKLVINFTIDPAGGVTEASQGMQDDQINDPDVVDCVTGVIKKITFAKSKANKTTRAYHRFEFAPGH